MAVIVAYCCTRYPATGCLPRICLRGNVIMEPLPISGSICHIIKCFVEWQVGIIRYFVFGVLSMSKDIGQ
jgi:hypothetical protein